MFSSEQLKKFGIELWSYTEEVEACSYSEYASWIAKGYAGGLNYLKDNRALQRKNLRHVFPDFQSALVFLFPYGKSTPGTNGYHLADYVVGFGGQDYHQVLKKKLTELFHPIAKDENIKYQIAIDILPILERDLAYRSGLGWFGKNSLLINKKLGSYFMIASILMDKKFSFQETTTTLEVDHCGHCTACIDACPTKAILPNLRQIDASMCISNFTIELFHSDKIGPTGYAESKEIFGCDICQTVCPWNQKVESGHDRELTEVENFFLNQPLDIVYAELSKMSKREFLRRFASTSLARTGRDGVMRNIELLLTSKE